MSRSPIIKELNDHGINTTSDGLLHDWLSRGLFKAAMNPLKEAILKRQREITFLKKLQKRLQEGEIDGAIS